VYEDVNQSIQHVHRSGLIHKKVLSEPQKFLKKNVGNTAFHDCHSKFFVLSLFVVILQYTFFAYSFTFVTLKTVASSVIHRARYSVS
jgi:hypothetical protein